MLLRDPDVATFLAASYNVRLATLSPRGVPLITPIWFSVDGEAIVIGTAGSALAVRNVKTNPQVVMCFDGEARPRETRVLRIRGTATATEEWLPLRLFLGLAAKYYLAPPALRSELSHIRQQILRARYYRQQSGPGLICIHPQMVEFLPRPSGLSA